jgi:outer membrane protein assembly factor BamB
LLSARHVNNIFIIDQDTGNPVWSWQGAPELDWQHHPVMLSNGKILVFDNGTRRGYSRVLELDPVNQATVWVYEAEQRTDFFTARGGDAQRLPNGNTLICESEKGRVFEVTSAGQIVWEFWHPEIAEENKRKTIYRMERIGVKDPRIKTLSEPND